MGIAPAVRQVKAASAVLPQVVESTPLLQYIGQAPAAKTTWEDVLNWWLASKFEKLTGYIPAVHQSPPL